MVRRRLDVSVGWPLQPAARLLDLTVRSAHYSGGAATAGASLRRADASKTKRYGHTVEPVSIEVGGRFSPLAIQSLERLAVDRCIVRPSMI